MDKNTSLVLIPEDERFIAQIRYIRFLYRSSYYKRIYVIDFLQKL